MYKRGLKRIFDFIISLLAIFILSPVFILVMVLIKLEAKNSIFFLQKRPGQYGKVFKVLKFKTMTDECDEDGNLLPDKDRLTSMGKLIRSASLDELPQLINVLKGDMSIVGPRPLLVKYLPLYNKFQSRRHEVRPGITGWAQVNGRNEITWSKRFELDVWYVDNVSFWLDIKIIILTIKKVFQREGINSPSNATMETFKGSKS